MTDLDIGGRVRRLRLRQRRTQQEISEACGFSKSLLSKIESNTVVPPVATLVKIAGALGTKVSTLIETEEDVRTVFTTGGDVEKGIVKTERGYSIFPFATQHREKLMQPFLFEARKGQVKEHHLTHQGEEFIYVLEGRMTVQVGSDEYVLEAGSSLYFSATDVHQVIPLSRTVRYLDIFV